jgi:hypothetical protein
MATAAQILTGPPAQIINKRGAGENISVSYWEHTSQEDGSPVESYSADEARVVRDIWVDHRDRLKAAKAFAGYARVLGSTDRNQVTAAAVAAGGAGGTNGTQVVVGTTGTGSFFQARVTVAGGAITAVLEVTYGGSYTVNPTSLTNEPVAGYGGTGAQLNLTMAPLTRKYISRLTPEPYRNAEAPWIWCNSVAPSRGFKRAGPSETEIAEYTFARLTCNYSNVRYRILPDDDASVVGLVGTPLAGLPDEARLTRYVSRVTRKASRLIAIPTGPLFYVPEGSLPGAPPDPDAPVGESFALGESRLTVVFTHHFLPAINWNTVWNCQFCVNDGWWPDRTSGYPPQTLLYDGPDVVERMCPFSGELMLDAAHGFTFAPRLKRSGPYKGVPMGWNSALRTKDGKLDYYEVATSAGDRPFPAVFFGDLFRP